MNIISYILIALYGLYMSDCVSTRHGKPGLRLGEKFLNLRSSILSRAIYFLSGARDDAHDAGKRFLANALTAKAVQRLRKLDRLFPSLLK